MTFQLSEAQIQQLADFMLSEPSSRDQHAMSEGLRFKAEKWARRLDPYDAMSQNIYRNRYERKLPDHKPIRCVRRAEDDPGWLEALENFNRRWQNEKTQ